MYKSWAETHNNKIKSILNAAREDHTNAVKQRIDSVKSLGGVVDVTRDLFAVSKVLQEFYLRGFFLSMDKITDNTNRKLLSLRPRLSSSSNRLLSPTRPGLFSTLGSGTRVRLSSASRRSWLKASWPRLTRSLTTPRCLRGFWTRALLMLRVCFHELPQSLSCILTWLSQESCRKPNRHGQL